MTRRGLIVFLVLALVLAVIVWLAVGAYRADAQQGPVASDRLAVFQQRIQDLVDYREWSDSQLAAMKVTIADLQKRLGSCNASPSAPPK